MTFIVPPALLRNHASVLEGAAPADVGAELIAYMCSRVGVPDLAKLDVLDVGCGTRFTDTFLNRGVPVGSYTGVDIDPKLVAFLKGAVDDPRLSYHLFDAYNPIYNPDGIPMDEQSRLPVGDRRFDLICLFSVFTHQLPEDARMLLALLREHVRDDGHLFFSARIDDDAGVDYYEADPANPAHQSRYSSALLKQMLAETGWTLRSSAPPWPDGVAVVDSFLCTPA